MTRDIVQSEGLSVLNKLIHPYIPCSQKFIEGVEKRNRDGEKEVWEEENRLKNLISEFVFLKSSNGTIHKRYFCKVQRFS